MKNLKSLPLLILLAFCFAYSCSSPENKIKKAIKEDLKLTLHDFKSYEPVQYGKFEAASSAFTDLPDYKLYLSIADEFLKQADEYDNQKEIYDYEFSRDKYWEYSNLQMTALRNAKVYLDKIDSLKLHFSSEHIGWQMTHTFRAKNLAGNLGLHHYIFVVDKEYKKVIKSINLDEE